MGYNKVVGYVVRDRVEMGTLLSCTRLKTCPLKTWKLDVCLINLGFKNTGTEKQKLIEYIEPGINGLLR